MTTPPVLVADDWPPPALADVPKLDVPPLPVEPPPAPIQTTEILVTPAGTIKVYDPAVVNS
jgi:hypothetical protein